MDIETTITSVVIILLCVIPIARMGQHRRNKEAVLFKALSDLAERNNNELSGFELWNNTAIGIDEKTKTVYFIRQQKNAETSHQINLSEIKKCQLINSNRTTNNNNPNQSVVDKLELRFIYNDKKEKEVVLEFYNTEFDSLILTGQLQLIERWNKVINQQLASN